jgi:uncharacterized protein YjbI with pentapeptide repeats
MTKTITVSDETYELIKSQVEKEESNKLQIKTLAGKVLFESDKTTLKEAVEEAVSRNVDLRDADLGDAYLRDADLGDADLRGTDLEGADLRGANLEGADLRGANLEGADFYHAKFYGRNGNTKIKKNQIDDFLTALGVVVEG